MGAHKKPFYRIVVADSRSPRDGRFIEELGYYNPLTDPADVKINIEKAKKWISTGAKPTDTVRGLLKKAGLFETAKETPSEAAQEPAAVLAESEQSEPEAAAATPAEDEQSEPEAAATTPAEDEQSEPEAKAEAVAD
jgi:small subunit ribosomal protein S16